MELDKPEFDRLAAIVKSKAVKTSVVADEEQAKSMTALDLFGHKWSVGDAYYTFPIMHREP